MKTNTFNAKIIVSWFIALVLAFVLLSSCLPNKNGCRATRNMRGYGFNENSPERLQHKAELIKADNTPRCEIEPHEYQIELELDAYYIYQNNRLVGIAPVTNSKKGIEGIILKDNL